MCLKKRFAMFDFIIGLMSFCKCSVVVFSQFWFVCLLEKSGLSTLLRFVAEERSGKSFILSRCIQENHVRNSD